MNCIKCNTDIGTSIGLCSACAANRSTSILLSKPSQANIKSGFGILDNLSIITENPKLFIIPGIIIFLVIFIGQHVGDQSLNINLSSNKLELSTTDGKSTLKYARGNNQSFTGRVYSFDENSFRISGGGSCNFLIAVSESDFEELRKCRGCKAPFINQFGKFFALIPSSDTVFSNLRSARLRYGDKIHIKGENLVLEAGTMNDSPFSISYGNLTPLMVSSLEEL